MADYNTTMERLKDLKATRAVLLGLGDEVRLLRRISGLVDAHPGGFSEGDEPAWVRLVELRDRLTKFWARTASEIHHRPNVAANFPSSATFSGLFGGSN